MGELGRESDPKKRKAIIDRIQVIFYDEVGRIKFGDSFTLVAARKDFRGEFRSYPVLFFWNSWLAR
jgi:ABC-type transport system substrate-binding protein